MNKITQTTRQIEITKAHQSQSQEPEKYEEVLIQLGNQLTQLRAEAKARKLARKAKKTSQAWTMNGVQVIPFQTGTMGITPVQANWTQQDFLIEVQMFANQVIKMFGIKGKVNFCSRRISFARKANMSVNFGSQSMQRAYTEGFAEYQQLKKMIAPYKHTGKTGLRLLVLHELAHLLVFMNNSKRVLPHGYEFQIEYAKLLKAFHSALEGK